ncbi:MAG: ATP-binding cassette domain-containing protein [Blastocatellia bacterium]|nr:ATP-binding cassette domain-containing protein [Blastocatellia bacterium]
MSSNLEVRGLDVTYSRWGVTVNALADIHLNVKQGEWVLVLGHNGSGKSTLLRALSGRIKPDAGEIRINGKDLEKMSAKSIARTFFRVLQDPGAGTAVTLTVRENLYVADQTPISVFSSRGLIEKYSNVLQPLGLDKRLGQLANTLSGGERQLLSLAVAAVHSADILLLDEVMASLDQVMSQICIDQIRRLNSVGKTVIQVMHDLDLAISLNQRIVVLNKGRVVYDGPVSSESSSRLRQLLKTSED